MEEISETSAGPLPESPPRADPFSRIRARTMLWIPVGAFVLMALLAGAFPKVMKEPYRFLTFGLTFSVAQMIWIGWQQRHLRLSLSAWLGPSLAGDDWKQLRIVLPLMLVSLGATWLVYVPLSYLFPKFVNDFIITDSPSMFIRGRTLVNVGVALLVVVIAPVVEEILFRGFLLNRWAYKWGTHRAILATSLAFGILHADVLGHTVFGVVMCFLYVRSGTLRLPIAAHMLNNALATVVAASALTQQQKSYTLAEFQSNWWVGVVCLIAGLTLMGYLTRGSWDLRAWRLPPAPPLADSPGAENAVPA
jgi:membrane protease YdiL (CAAX protease family)